MLRFDKEKTVNKQIGTTFGYETIKIDDHV